MSACSEINGSITVDGGGHVRGPLSGALTEVMGWYSAPLDEPLAWAVDDLVLRSRGAG
jgi:hypothetical protein